ncbi:MAG: hypothetical protein WDO56_09680 [Gammaproteobacteria bacterium]
MIPLATAILGLLIGAVISEMHVALAGARERRRALNVLLFDLLQLRFDIRTANPRLMMEMLQRIVRRKFGAAHANFTAPPELHQIMVRAHQELTRSDRFRLTERFQSALHALVPHDPMLAYSLPPMSDSQDWSERFACITSKWRSIPNSRRTRMRIRFLG